MITLFKIRLRKALHCVKVNKFARLVFGLIQSPFIFEATLKVHLHKYQTNSPQVIENIYIDGLRSGGSTVW